MKKTTMLFTFLTATLLTACSGEPSEANIKEAIKYQNIQSLKRSGATLDQAEMKLGEDVEFQQMISNLQKIKCNKESESLPYYSCLVQIDTRTPTIMLIKTKDGWKLKNEISTFFDLLNSLAR